MIVIHNAQKLLKACENSKGNTALKSSSLIWEWVHPLSADTMSKNIELRSTENALDPLYDQPIGRKQLEKLLEMFMVIFMCTAGHKNVINIDIGQRNVS